MSGQAFAHALVGAETRLRACGLTGRAAYVALCRHLGARLGLPPRLWMEGPDAPVEADLGRVPLTEGLDLFGLTYERFFSDVFKAERGQYFTPRPLVELLVALSGVGPGDRVLDPTCGSGGFLVMAHRRGAQVRGLELDPELVSLCRLNLALAGASPGAVEQADLFTAPIQPQWDVVLANPPFSLPIDHPAALAHSALAAGRARVASDVLFLECAARALRPGGRLATVVPHSLVANPSHAPVRAWMDATFARRAVITLPEGVFRPFGGTAARACLLVLAKRPAAAQDWCAEDLKDLGYDPTRKVYRRQGPDGLAALAQRHRDGSLVRVAAGEARWLPAEIHSMDGIAGAIERVRLGDLAPVAHRPVRPSADPGSLWTEIDLGDVDKDTGEVSRARPRRGAELKGTKAGFDPGDVLVSRLRPNLNTVVRAQVPTEGLPEALCGSSEWVRLVPLETPEFVLLAARSSFVRAQLGATGGQTRPRVRAQDIAGCVVPDPGPELRGLLDQRLGALAKRRRADRLEMDRIRGLYEAFGRGEISADALRRHLA